MKSELKALIDGHNAAVEALRKRCVHEPKNLKIHEDHSVVGRGSSGPSIHVVCRNCGTKKIIFRRTEAEYKRKVEKTMAKQGFEDERLGCAITYEWELE
jgi:hypothetical protein